MQVKFCNLCNVLAFSVTFPAIFCRMLSLRRCKDQLCAESIGRMKSTDMYA